MEFLKIESKIRLFLIKNLPNCYEPLVAHYIFKNIISYFKTILFQNAKSLHYWEAAKRILLVVGQLRPATLCSSTSITHLFAAFLSYMSATLGRVSKIYSTFQGTFPISGGGVNPCPLFVYIIYVHVKIYFFTLIFFLPYKV